MNDESFGSLISCTWDEYLNGRNPTWTCAAGQDSPLLTRNVRM